MLVYYYYSFHVVEGDIKDLSISLNIVAISFMARKNFFSGKAQLYLPLKKDVLRDGEERPGWEGELDQPRLTER